MKAIVTGGLGFIGSAVAEKLRKEMDVLVVDDCSYGREENLPEGCSFIKMNARDIASCGYQPDYVFHFGSHSSILHSFKDPVGTAEDTITGVGGVVSWASKHNVRMVLASSATVYGTAPLPHSESSDTRPVGEYAVAKLLGEKMASGSGAALLRIFSGYGPGEMQKTWYKSPVGMFIESAIRKEPMVVYGDGSQTRDFVYISDIAAAAVEVAKSDHVGPINIGTGTETAILDLARMIAKELGRGDARAYRPYFEGYVRRMKADTNLFASKFSTRFRSIGQGIADFIDSETFRVVQNTPAT